jgi:hypothetical protein
LKDLDKCGLSWDGNIVWGDRKSIESVKAAVHAQSTVAQFRDEVMRLQVRIEAMRPAYEKAMWAPGTYQNGA